MDYENTVRQDVKSIDNEEMTHVELNEGEIENVVSQILDNAMIPEWDAPVFPEDENNFAELMVVGNAINFAFNDPDTGEKYSTNYFDVEWDGSFGMWATLHRAMFQYKVPVNDPEWLMNVSVSEFEELTEPVEVDMPYIEKRVDNLNSLGEYFVESRYNRIKSIFTEFNNLYGSDGLVEELAHTEAYKDVRDYKNNTVRFDKRLQLCMAMVYDRVYHHNSLEWGNFEDIDKMTIFADYGIPAYLASEDLIEYSPELQSKIDNNKKIPENSKEEVEIRLATVNMGERIQDYIYENKNIFISVPELDYALWSLRKEAETNEHLTPTDSY